MTTAARAGTDRSAGRSQSASDLGDRGTTRITDRVIERLAGRAASEAGGTNGLDKSVLGMKVGGRGDARARVSVDGDHVTARVSTSVEYPSPVRQVARRVRELVSARITEMTGMAVDRVDVEVATFDHPDGDASAKPRGGRSRDGKPRDGRRELA